MHDVAASAPGNRWYLVLAAAVTAVLWQVPHGQQILWPFTLLATYAHEMGHGLTAVLLGGDFSSLTMELDGSGMAQWSGQVGRIGQALIAAGGLVGPSVAGAILLVLAKKPARAKWLLLAVGVGMLGSLLLVAKGPVAAGFTLAAGLLILGTARWFPARGAPFLAQLLGVQLCIAIYRDIDYMFMSSAGPGKLSDTARMAEALLLPYWFWGAVTAAFSVAVLVAGVWAATRSSAGVARPSTVAAGA
jgi:hypothetical protein